MLSVAFVTLDYRGGSFSAIRTGASAVFGPVQRGFGTVFGPVSRFFAGLPEVGSSSATIDQLRQDNSELSRQLRDNQLNADRGEELDRLKLLAGRGQYRTVPASVISLSPSLGFEWTVTLDVGTQDGVKEDMTVVNGDGLVGRVKEAGPSTCVVILAIDPGSSVGVRTEGSGELGLVNGNGMTDLAYDPLDPQADIHRGDRLVTGPYGATTYAPGVPVGEVVSVSADRHGDSVAKVRPYAKPSALDLVGVIVEGPSDDPRDSVLPPKPEG